MIGNDGAGRPKRWRELLASERDAAALYTRIAEAETGERRDIFEELAAVERRHAAHWEDKIRGAGENVPPAGKAGGRAPAPSGGPRPAAPRAGAAPVAAAPPGRA